MVRIARCEFILEPELDRLSEDVHKEFPTLTEMRLSYPLSNPPTAQKFEWYHVPDGSVQTGETFHDVAAFKISFTPLHTGDQPGGDKPSNIGVGKAVGISRDQDRAPIVFSDGPSVLTRLDRSTAYMLWIPRAISVDCAVRLPTCSVSAARLPFPLSRRVPSEIWEPGA